MVATAGMAVVPARALAEEAGGAIDGLLADLAEPDRQDWMQIEAEIVRRWSRSGSEAMDLLLRRGQEAVEVEHWVAAVEHLTALIDHAPDFVEGYFTRSTAFHGMGEYTLALADLEAVLAREPRHFGALMRLGVILEGLGRPELALRAHEAALALHPHRPEVLESIERLRRLGGAAEI